MSADPAGPPLFAPLFAELAAAVDGTDPTRFRKDAGRLSVVLRDLARALPVDVLMVDSGSGWDLELAAQGQRPPPEDLETAVRLSPTLEALRRLREIVPAEVRLGVVVTGSGAARVPSGWAQALNGVVRLALEAGASLVLVAEGPAAPADPTAWAREMTPVWGTVRFYRGTPGLLLVDPDAAWASVEVKGVPVVTDAGAPGVLSAAKERGAWGIALRPGADETVSGTDVSGAAIVTTAGDLSEHVGVDALAATVRSLARVCNAR